jgi:hypothetical protein
MKKTKPVQNRPFKVGFIPKLFFLDSNDNKIKLEYEKSGRIKKNL